MLSWTSWLEVERGAAVLFWRARTEGDSALIHEGVLGTSGTTQITKFPTAIEAHQQIVALVERQRAQGYKDPREIFLDWASEKIASLLGAPATSVTRSLERVKCALPAHRSAALRVSAPEHRPRVIEVSVEIGNAHAASWPDPRFEPLLRSYRFQRWPAAGYMQCGFRIPLEEPRYNERREGIAACLELLARWAASPGHHTMPIATVTASSP